MRENFRTLDLNLLRVFDALMAEGNVTRTAQRLALTQSAVSNALARLRVALGDALFVKTRTGVLPTAAARQMWAVMGPHFAALREAIEPSTFDPAVYDGSIRIAMSDYTVERVMPRLAAHLCERAPRLRIDLAPYSVANIPALFEAEGVDLAIGAYLNDTNQISGIRSRMLWPIHSSCLMRRNHRLAQSAMTLEDFLKARHIDVLLPGMYVPAYDSLLWHKRRESDPAQAWLRGAIAEMLAEGAPAGTGTSPIRSAARAPARAGRAKKKVRARAS